MGKVCLSCKGKIPISSANTIMNNKVSIKRDRVFKKALRHMARILLRLGHVEIFSSIKSTHNWVIRVLVECFERTTEFLLKWSSVWAKTLTLELLNFYYIIFHFDSCFTLVLVHYLASHNRLKFLFYISLKFISHRNYHSMSLKSNGLMPAFMMALKCRQWTDILALLLLIRIPRDRREITTFNPWWTKY